MQMIQSLEDRRLAGSAEARILDQCHEQTDPGVLEVEVADRIDLLDCRIVLSADTFPFGMDQDAALDTDTHKTKCKNARCPHHGHHLSKNPAVKSTVNILAQHPSSVPGDQNRRLSYTTHVADSPW